MKTSIYARVGVKPINFPDVIEIHYQCLDEQNRITGENYRGLRFTWDEIQYRFLIDVEHTKTCEAYFRDGQIALLRTATVTGKFYERGETLPESLAFPDVP